MLKKLLVNSAVLSFPISLIKAQAVAQPPPLFYEAILRFVLQHGWLPCFWSEKGSLSDMV
jgi:hypothetical protein